MWVRAAGNWMARLLATGALLVTVSCGGGSVDAALKSDVTSTTLAVAAPQRAAQVPLATPALPTPVQAMDWAEAHYPDLFPAGGSASGELPPYVYRYYPSTHNYLAISTGDDVAVYIYGAISPDQVTRLAPLSNYTCEILPQNCEPPVPLSNNIAVWGDSLTPPFAANLQLLFPQTVYNGGVASETSTQVAAREIADTERHAWINVFWFGHNNDDDPARIKTDMASCVDALVPGNSRFVVLSLLNSDIPSELKGTEGYQRIVNLNNDLAAIYPQNYIDIRSYLISHYDPSNPQDVKDFQNDLIPSSLRFPNDVDHLNNTGSVLVARKVQEFINAKGW